MDISALEAFRAIAESGSLTRAAERLHVSQPAMSAALKKFETELGARLFDREANRIRLNAAGEVALERVNAVLRAVEKLREDVRRAAGQGQTLCIAFCDPGVRWFSAPRFAVARPDMDVRDDLYEGIDAARLLTVERCVAFGLMSALVLGGALTFANYGQMRLFAFLGAGAGAALYALGPHRLGRGLLHGFVRKFRRIWRRIVKFRLFKVIFR